MKAAAAAVAWGDLEPLRSYNIALGSGWTAVLLAHLGEVAAAEPHIVGHRGLIHLAPENRHYQPIVVDLKKSEFAIEGLAVGIIRTRI